MQPGDEIPELKVTPDKYLTVPLRGRLGRLQPDPHRRGVRQAGRPARAILHGLWTMAQVARAQTEAGGGPHALKRLEVQFRGMGLPEQEITVTATVHEVARRRRDRRHRAEQDGNGDHPQRRSRDREPR